VFVAPSILSLPIIKVGKGRTGTPAAAEEFNFKVGEVKWIIRLNYEIVGQSRIVNATRNGACGMDVCGDTIVILNCQKNGSIFHYLMLSLSLIRE
jgi:hypothetical protein